MRIIVDTGIWYSLSDGKIDWKLTKGLPLFLTAANVMELIVTPYLKTDPDKVIRVCKMIRRINPGYIERDPYSYLAREVFGKKIKTKYEVSLLNRIVERSIEPIIIEKLVELKRIRSEDFKEKIRIAQQANKESSEIISRLDNPKLGEIAVLQDTQQELEKTLGVNPFKFYPQKVENSIYKVRFYLNIRLAYYKALNLTTRKRYEPNGNDQMDLLQTVYVGPQDKYWVEDDKWVKLIHDAGLQSQIF